MAVNATDHRGGEVESSIHGLGSVLYQDMCPSIFLQHFGTVVFSTPSCSNVPWLVAGIVLVCKMCEFWKVFQKPTYFLVFHIATIYFTCQMKNRITVIFRDNAEILSIRRIQEQGEYIGDAIEPLLK